MSSWTRAGLARLGALLALSLAGLVCSHAAPPSLDPGQPAASPLLSGEIPPPASGSLHALLINGGGAPEVNYRSHRQHLEILLEQLAAAGVAAERITVLASDGADPAPDLAILEEPADAELWLLPRTGAVAYLQPRIEYVSTELGPITPRPASHAELERWFREQGSRLRPGDTLLLYVTDHGEKNEADLADNTIALWGESLGVRQLQAHLDRLDPGVRVVMLMSQCFGGSFAHAIFRGSEPHELRGNVCGYFATTADRPAYGCYPETSGREGVGHSHEILGAWGQLGELARSHRRALVTDRTPDVPNTSRDFFLAGLMEREAARAGLPLDPFVDRWLRQAWKNRARWEPELRLLDQIAHGFGLFSPRSLADFAGKVDELTKLGEQLEVYAERWEQALEAARGENWRRFLLANPAWSERIVPAALQSLGASERVALRAELLTALAGFTRGGAATHERLLSLRSKQADARSARYRSEVRVGALLRMRTLLVSIAGRTWLEQAGDRARRDEDGRLARCEVLNLGRPAGELAAFEPPEALPQLSQERESIASVMPAWMGIRYQPVSRPERSARPLPRGAVQVMTVYPDSPAKRADIRVADVLLGAPGQPFDEPHAVREWTMRSEVDRPTRLELLRGREIVRVDLTPSAFPLELPRLPGPPQVGSTAPPLDLELYRGEEPGGSTGSRLLFFWATWCTPCKQSVPELLAFAAARGVEILAITDEEPAQLDPFFEDLGEPFPRRVATDPARMSFQLYGVSGTPTFVLVDAEGVIRHYQRGYSPASGLSIDGWSYAPRVQ